MPESKRVDGLQINQDTEFQARTWRIQRVAWTVGLVVLVAAALGLLGPGPLSSTSAGEPGSALFVEYDRFARYQSPVRMRVTAGPGIAADGTLRVRLSRGLTDAVQVVGVLPDPERVEATADELIYVFAVADATRPVGVLFEFEPSEFGRIGGHVAVDGGPSHRIGTFVYP